MALPKTPNPNKHIRDIRKDRVIKNFLQGPGLDIYEGSAGRGDLAIELQCEGHNVLTSNHGPGGIRYDVPMDVVDLTGPLPYEDNAFDAIILREVIEHLESAPHILRECLRCLRPGGRLILTFPNRLQFRSRLYHLLTGFYNGLKSPMNLDIPFSAGHINIIGLPEMDYFLTRIGFGDIEYASSEIKPVDRALLLFWPLCWAVSRFSFFAHKKRTENHRKDRPEDVAYITRIFKALTSLSIFSGKDVIVKAVKPA